MISKTLYRKLLIEQHEHTGQKTTQRVYKTFLSVTTFKRYIFTLKIGLCAIVKYITYQTMTIGTKLKVIT
jgi:hypothetical protein